MQGKFGNSPVSEPALEIQCYASTANFTINLLDSPFGIGYVNVIERPSNGQELLLFFEEAVSLTRADGFAVLERGDSVVMDNCGFHHGHFVEPILTEMLDDCRVQLIFQPPYSPQFNMCELCFHQVKAFLQLNPHLAQEETDFAMYPGGMQKRDWRNHC